MNVLLQIVGDGKQPVYSRDGDACLDCFSRVFITIEPGERAKIPLGFALSIPRGYEGVIRPRSGMTLHSHDSYIGTIDSNYTGEVSAIIKNDTDDTFYVNKYDRVCQLAIRKTEEINFIRVNELPKTERGSNGFGSSGK